jgi:FlaA1/EpsC-like NDP-sugar epimerase
MTKKDDGSIRVLIIGAGEAGCLVAEDIENDKETSFYVVGFLDDDAQKKGKVVAGKPVFGTVSEISKVAKENEVKEIIIAIPSERGSLVRRIVDLSSGLGLSYKILPRISEVLIQGVEKDYIRYIRKVTAEDLLGGEIVKKDQEQVDEFAHNKTFLITGAAGSIGSELSRQLSAYGAKKIIFYDWWENGMFELQNYITQNYPKVDCEYIIGDIKDRVKLNSVMSCYKPDVVLHAAAYKHVPLMEVNAVEAIKNNIFGTKNVAELSIKHGVSKFILISTDKAVNPNQEE